MTYVHPCRVPLTTGTTPVGFDERGSKKGSLVVVVIIRLQKVLDGLGSWNKRPSSIEVMLIVLSPNSIAPTVGLLLRWIGCCRGILV